MYVVTAPAFLDDEFGRSGRDDASTEDGLRAGVEIGPWLGPNARSNWRQACHWPVPPRDFDNLSPFDTRQDPFKVLLEFTNGDLR